MKARDNTFCSNRPAPSSSSLRQSQHTATHPPREREVERGAEDRKRIKKERVKMERAGCG